MAILKVEDQDLSCLLDKLSVIIDLNKDLPENIFVGDEFLFWFFERPLICFLEIFAGLISASVSNFKLDVFVKFSGGEALSNSCFSFDGTSIETDILWLNRKFDSFFCGAVGYPIVLFDSACNWVAFESAYEEFGVVAVKKSRLKEGFCEYLNSNFISINELEALASGSSAEGKIARALISAYCS